MARQLVEFTLTELSKIQVRYFLTPLSRQSYLCMLTVKYLGTYGIGSGGNPDAQFMFAMAKAGVAALSPWGVIHDLSELRYEWGDKLVLPIGVGPDLLCHETPAPIAVVVGPGCEEALRTLLFGENSKEPIEKAGNVFRDLEVAQSFVEERIEAGLAKPCG